MPECKSTPCSNRCDTWNLTDCIPVTVSNHLNFKCHACFDVDSFLNVYVTWSENIGKMHHADKYSQHNLIIWLNGKVFVYELSSFGFESRCSHSNLRHLARSSLIFRLLRVQIHSKRRVWPDKNRQWNAAYR